MATSQNGWPVDYDGDLQDRAPIIRDVTVPNGVRRGDVATVFRWLARQYDRRVERLKRGWCWGWWVKTIEGTSVVSNHASGTAVDFNAPDNPMRTGSTEKSLTDAQIDECHALERESGHVLRWGGDFTRDDPMHWEIVGTPEQVAQLARRIRAEEESDDMDADALRTILRDEIPTIMRTAAGGCVSDLDQERIAYAVQKRIAPPLARLEAAAAAEAREVPPAAVDVAAAVLDALGAAGPDETPEDTAAKLRTALDPVLGDRAPEVYRALAG